MIVGEKMIITPIRSKTDVMGHLEKRLLEGEFAVGQKLPSERELSSNYGVSRPFMREALAGLVERGYLDVFAGRGSFVRAVSTDELSQSLTRVAIRAGVTARNLVAARVMLECSAAEMAAINATPRDIAQIFDALESHNAATTIVEQAASDLVFHEAIATSSGNPVISLMFGAIRIQVYALMLRSHSDRTVRHLGDPLHERIAESIRDRNPTQARTAMSEHLELALSLYGEDLDRPLSEVLENRGLKISPLLQPGESFVFSSPRI